MRNLLLCLAIVFGTVTINACGITAGGDRSAFGAIHAEKEVPVDSIYVLPLVITKISPRYGDAGDLTDPQHYGGAGDIIDPRPRVEANEMVIVTKAGVAIICLDVYRDSSIDYAEVWVEVPNHATYRRMVFKGIGNEQTTEHLYITELRRIYRNVLQDRLDSVHDKTPVTELDSQRALTPNNLERFMRMAYDQYSNDRSTTAETE